MLLGGQGGGCRRIDRDPGAAETDEGESPPGGGERLEAPDAGGQSAGADSAGEGRKGKGLAAPGKPEGRACQGGTPAQNGRNQGSERRVGAPRGEGGGPRGGDARKDGCVDGVPEAPKGERSAGAGAECRDRAPGQSEPEGGQHYLAIGVNWLGKLYAGVLDDFDAFQASYPVLAGVVKAARWASQFCDDHEFAIKAAQIALVSLSSLPRAGGMLAGLVAEKGLEKALQPLQDWLKNGIAGGIDDIAGLDENGRRLLKDVSRGLVDKVAACVTGKAGSCAGEKVGQKLASSGCPQSVSDAIASHRKECSAEKIEGARQKNVDAEC